MLRIEHIIGGLILVAIGTGLFVTGYQKTQPDDTEEAIEQVAETVEELTEGQVRAEVEDERNITAYVMMGGGGIATIFGLLLILGSRTNPPGK